MGPDVDLFFVQVVLSVFRDAGQVGDVAIQQRVGEVPGCALGDVLDTTAECDPSIAS